MTEFYMLYKLWHLHVARHRLDKHIYIKSESYWKRDKTGMGKIYFMLSEPVWADNKMSKNHSVCCPSINATVLIYRQKTKKYF